MALKKVKLDHYGAKNTDRQFSREEVKMASKKHRRLAGMMEATRHDD